VYRDWREMLAAEELDIVSVSTYTPAHAPVTIACARAGVSAVFCEKPLAVSLRAADTMIEECRRAGTLLVVNHSRRWDPAFMEAARLIDAMEHIETYERAVLSHDVPHEVCALHNAEASLTSTTKHHWIGPMNGYCLEKIVDMAAAIAGGRKTLEERPLVTFNTCPVSPLKLVKDCCEIIMGSARTGMAVNILSMGMAGGSTPVYTAGTLVVHNAEVLSGLVLNQLTRKGAPVVYGSSTTAMDLRMASASVGTPECAVINAAVARLARYYALPSFVAGG